MDLFDFLEIVGMNELDEAVAFEFLRQKAEQFCDSEKIYN